VLLQVYLIARRGADWWADNMLRHKTYVEARSVASPYIAFWRVYAFHAALLTIMAALVGLQSSWLHTACQGWFVPHHFCTDGLAFNRIVSACSNSLQTACLTQCPWS